MNNMCMTGERPEVGDNMDGSVDPEKSEVCGMTDGMVNTDRFNGSSGADSGSTMTSKRFVV